MNGFGMGDHGRIASRMRSAATPTASTDSPRLRARRPKNRSAFDSQVAPSPANKRPSEGNQTDANLDNQERRPAGLGET